jgi:hypothetical protein
MYRADQCSYLLYPDRRLARFVEKNNLPAASVTRSPLLGQLLADGNQLLIERDGNGICHFSKHISNARDVSRILGDLMANGYAGLVKRDSAFVLKLFEKMFNHRSFTGRSGTFFGYEGLGCIYWHMVSKLMLAAQEAFHHAIGTPFAAPLAKCYRDLRTGIGDYKTPKDYGAFPMDPYSHTPAHAGARQPGLTGQVKEDILCRFGELGVSVREGRIHFEPNFLCAGDFLAAPEVFNYCNLSGRTQKIPLKAGALAFTYCQVPVVYERALKPLLEIRFTDGKRRRQDIPVLNEKNSRSIFERSGVIKSIFVGIQPAILK